MGPAQRAGTCGISLPGAVAAVHIPVRRVVPAAVNHPDVRRGPDARPFNNRVGYIILHIEQPGLPGLPLAVVVLTASLASVPPELDEAAWMEGASYLAYLRRVIVPPATPGTISGRDSSGRVRSWSPMSESSSSRSAHPGRRPLAGYAGEYSW
jgi:ABC-type Fe3+ transport system permease subunit